MVLQFVNHCHYGRRFSCNTVICQGYFMEIEEIIKKISDNNHYILKSKNDKAEYYDDFSRVISILKEKLTEKEYTDLLVNKLQIKDTTFDEKAFIQIACETTVNAYFAKNYKDSFEYEVQVNPNNKKNVECQFKENDFKYNVEVKCPNFTNKETIDEMNAFKFGTFGRVEDYKEMMDELSETMTEAQKSKGEEVKPLVESKKMDNNLKDFLILANEKFNPNSDETEVNILFVCGDDANDIQNWHYYLFAPRGLFSNNSFCDKEQYNQVDVVVLTNLYHRHHKYNDKSHLKFNWTLDSAFILIFSNPFTSERKEKGIKNFIKIFPHYNEELMRYEVPGNSPQELKEILKIPWFVKEGLEDRGIILF